MAAKRPHDDIGAEDHEASSQESVEPTAKKPKPSSGKPAHQPRGTGISKAKKRARTIRKQFAHDDDIAADVRVELERELAVHEAAIADHAFHKTRAAMISKYHKIRFFERKKAMRLVKQTKKKLDQESDPKVIKQLKHELHVAEVDEAYAQHYPHAEAYISLYPKASSSKDEESPATEATHEAERPPIWTVIEQAMAKGSGALKEIRERRVPSESTSEPKKLQYEQQKPSGRSAASKSETPGSKEKVKKHSGQQPMNRRERRKLMREMAPAEGGGDDGNNESFFE